MAGGRPLKFNSPEELEKKIDEYFTITKPEEITITGLALHLDTSRCTLVNYENRDEFFNTIKKGKDRVEHEYEKSLRKRGSAGDIFGLKNFGWKDKQEQEVNQTNLNFNKEDLSNMTNEEFKNFRDKYIN